MERLIGLSLTIFLALTVPVYGERSSFSGSAEIKAETKRADEECDPGAKAQCKEGELCFANLIIQGEAARVLYEEFKRHGAGGGAVGEFATKSEVMACAHDDAGYWCEVGYDAVNNELTYPIYCQEE